MEHAGDTSNGQRGSCAVVDLYARDRSCCLVSFLSSGISRGSRSNFALASPSAFVLSAQVLKDCMPWKTVANAPKNHRLFKVSLHPVQDSGTASSSSNGMTSYYVTNLSKLIDRSHSNGLGQLALGYPKITLGLQSTVALSNSSFILVLWQLPLGGVPTSLDPTAESWLRLSVKGTMSRHAENY